LTEESWRKSKRLNLGIGVGDDEDDHRGRKQSGDVYIVGNCTLMGR